MPIEHRLANLLPYLTRTCDHLTEHAHKMDSVVMSVESTLAYVGESPKLDQWTATVNSLCTFLTIFRRVDGEVVK